MKKLLSLLLAFALVLTMMPSALAASDEQTQAADALHTLGLFQGTGTKADGTPNYDLDRTPTRSESVAMLVRLLGKESEAKSKTWNIPFSDVAAWAQPYVGYAYANGFVNGTSQTTFSGDDVVTAAHYLTFILRVLGYSSNTDFQWDRAWDLSDKLGITNGEYSSNGPFTRGDMAVISRNALDATYKNSEKTLLSSLDLSVQSKPSTSTSSSSGAYQAYYELLTKTKASDIGFAGLWDFDGDGVLELMLIFKNGDNCIYAWDGAKVVLLTKDAPAYAGTTYFQVTKGGNGKRYLQYTKTHESIENATTSYFCLLYGKVGMKFRCVIQFSRTYFYDWYLSSTKHSDVIRQGFLITTYDDSGKETSKAVSENEWLQKMLEYKSESMYDDNGTLITEDESVHAEKGSKIFNLQPVLNQLKTLMK